MDRVQRQQNAKTSNDDTDPTVNAVKNIKTNEFLPKGNPSRGLTILDRYDENGDFIIRDNVRTKKDAEGNIVPMQVVDVNDALGQLKEERGDKDLSERNEENLEILSDLFASEAEAALQSNSDALGWYDRTLKAAKKVASILHPEILDNEDANHAYDFATAVTSNGMPALDNWKYADEQYKHWVDTGGLIGEGRFIIKGYGENSVGMEKAFELYNTLRDEGLSDIEVRELLSKEVLVKDLLDIPLTSKKGENRTIADRLGVEAKDISQETVDTPVFVSYLLGAKIGQGFYQNLRGNYNPLTMDVWFTRTWNRYLGKPFTEPQQKTIDKNYQKLRTSLLNNKKDLSKDEKKIVNTILKKYGIKKSSSNEDLQKAAIEIDKAYQTYFTKVQSPLKKADRIPKSRIILDVSNLVRNTTVQEQATPRSGTERQWIRDVVSRALDKLKDRGTNLETADFQALMWFAEKRLLKSMGVRQGRGSDNDYLDAAIELARKKGITDEEIRQQLPRDFRERLSNRELRQEGNEGTSKRSSQAVQEKQAVLTLGQQNTPNWDLKNNLTKLLQKNIEDGISDGFADPKKVAPRKLLEAVDPEGRKLLSRFISGIDDKGLSDEDFAQLLPWLNLSFEFNTAMESLGEYEFRPNNIGVKDGILQKIPPKVRLDPTTDAAPLEDLLAHEISHHITQNTFVNKFLKDLWKATTQWKGKKPNDKPNISKAKRVLLKEAIKASKQFLPLFNEVEIAYNELISPKSFKNKLLLEQGYEIPTFEDLGLERVALEGSAYLMPPTSEVQRILNYQKLYQKMTAYERDNGGASTNLDLYDVQEVKVVKKIYETLDYLYSAPELGANAVAYYLRYPKYFKRTYPTLSTALRSIVNNSEFKNILALKSIIGMVGASTIMALLSQYGDDEEGVLNFGEGILAA